MKAAIRLSVPSRRSNLRAAFEIGCCLALVLCVLLSAALAHYNAAIELELDEREVGAFYTRMRKELLEILAQGGRDTFTDEMRHAIAVAYEKMGVEPIGGKDND